MDVKIVNARREHAEFVAWVMLAASRSHLERSIWDFYVGGSEADCLRWLTALSSTKQRHWAHYSEFMVAEVDGRPASGLSGYWESDHDLVTEGIAEADRAVGRTEQDAAAGWQRAGTILHVTPDHAPGVWIVEHVATRPEFRRRGLVDRLLAEMVDRGRSAGAKVADIGIFIGNDPAQRAYEKAGFKVVGDKTHPDFEAAYKCPGMRLLSQPL